MLVGRPFHNGVLDTLFAPPQGGLARLLGGLAGHFFLGPVGALCARLLTGPRRGARTSKNMFKGAFGTILRF